MNSDCYVNTWPVLVGREPSLIEVDVLKYDTVMIGKLRPWDPGHNEYLLDADGDLLVAALTPEQVASLVPID